MDEQEAQRWKRRAEDLERKCEDRRDTIVVLAVLVISGYLGMLYTCAVRHEPVCLDEDDDKADASIWD